MLKKYEDAINSFDKALEYSPATWKQSISKEDAETELRKIKTAENLGEKEEEKTEEIDPNS